MQIILSSLFVAKTLQSKEVAIWRTTEADTLKWQGFLPLDTSLLAFCFSFWELSIESTDTFGAERAALAFGVDCG